jgi:ferredoxin
MNKYVLKYSAEEAKRPLLAEAVLKTGVLVNILIADVEYSSGRMVVSVLGDGKQQEKLVGYLRERGVEVEKLEGNILKDEDKCVDCCECYGVCPTKAILIKDNRMLLDNDDCIRCKACIEVCPTRALSLREG